MRPNYLQKAIEIRPDYPEALNNLGIIFVRLQNYEKAEEQFKTGIRLVSEIMIRPISISPASMRYRATGTKREGF